MSKEISPQEVKTMAFAVFACTAVVLLVLLIDMRIAKSIVQKAEEWDGRIQAKRPLVDMEALRKAAENERQTNRGSTSGASVSRGDGMASVGRDSRMETGNIDPGMEAESPEESPWDVFPVSRTQ